MEIDMSVYASNARFDGIAKAMNEDEIRRIAPSIFAVSAHESRSQRFVAVPTIDVLRGLANEGFMTVGVKQSTTRDDTKKEFTKHMVRLRKIDGDARYSVGDNVCEIVLKNANDGTSAYDLMAGMFRIRCLNSLVAQTSTIDSVKVRHSGNAIDNVIEGTFRVLNEAEKLLSAPADWSKIQLNQDERQILAESAHIIRFGDAEGNVETPIKAEQLLRARRIGDKENDLWTVGNVIQENVIKGGLSAYAAPKRDIHGRVVSARRVTTRAVNGIDQDVKLNKALWTLNEQMFNLLKRSA
jgi:hypothetical protein